MINYSIDASLSLENKQNMDNSFCILRFHTVIEKYLYVTNFLF